MALLQDNELKEISDEVSGKASNGASLGEAISMAAKTYLKHLESILEEEGEDGPIPTEGQTYAIAKDAVSDLLFIFGINLNNTEENNG